jgi:hypothetical protein
VHRPQRGQVLKRHLRWAIRTYLDPGVRAHQADVHLRNPSHADKVVGTREEHRKGGGEQHVPPDGEPDGCGHQLLLNDEHLVVPLGADLLELLGVGGVADFAVQDNDLGTVSQGGQGCP